MKLNGIITPRARPRAAAMTAAMQIARGPMAAGLMTARPSEVLQ